MYRFCSLLAVVISTFSFGQNHQENFRTITTEEQAESYAASFQEVFTGTVNIEKDVFFFDDIDTSKMESYIGTSKSFFGKTTKMLKDSVFNIVNVQIIHFDLKKISPETADILLGQMKKMLDEGSTYWEVKKRFSHTSAKFSSSPEIVEEVEKEYGVAEVQLTEDSFHEWDNSEEGKSKGILFVDKKPHPVPGFFTISYLNLNNGDVR